MSPLTNNKSFPVESQEVASMVVQHERLTQIVDNDGRPMRTEGAESEYAGRAAEPAHVAGDGQAPVAEHVIENPISGERIIIRESGAQTGGQLLSFDLFLPPGAHVPARHVHPAQEEQFTVMAGQMRFRLGRRTILANPGDTVRVPAGKAHWFGNSGAGIAHARVEARPALRMEEAFEAAATMGTAGSVLGIRLPRLSDLALYLIEFQREMAVPDVPPFLVRTLLAPLAWLGRRHRDAKPGSVG
jgi:quercetin dioxygenase-like cupin family protein